MHNIKKHQFDIYNIDPMVLNSGDYFCSQRSVLNSCNKVRNLVNDKLKKLSSDKNKHVKINVNKEMNNSFSIHLNNKNKKSS